MAIPDLSSLTLAAIQAALKSGEILKRGFGTTFEMTAKPGRQNIVTEYDKASEKCIISFIHEQFPSHSFLAEESGYSKQSGEDQVHWIIDPLDGTTNFVRRIPIFTISIAAYYQGKGLCGVIFQPLTKELFIAERGRGAYLNGERLHVSHTSLVEDALLIASLPYDATSIPKFDIEKLVHIAREGVTFRNLGSAALALAYIAGGKADGFWMYNLYPWDLAAGQLLIEEAGGRLIRFETGQDLIHSPANVLASNQALFSSLQKYLI
jgi:myo-inositol-1(or 4)-monophosphatase